MIQLAHYVLTWQLNLWLTTMSVQSDASLLSNMIYSCGSMLQICFAGSDPSRGMASVVLQNSQ